MLSLIPLLFNRSVQRLKRVLGYLPRSLARSLALSILDARKLDARAKPELPSVALKMVVKVSSYGFRPRAQSACA